MSTSLHKQCLSIQHVLLILFLQVSHPDASLLAFGFFALAMAAGGLLDDAMAKFGGKSWSLSTLDSPSCTSKNEQDIEDPITISAFIAAVGRSQDGLCQTVNLLFDELLRLKQKNVQTCLRLANLLLQLVHAETCQESCCKVDLHVELSVPYLLKRPRFSQGIMFRVQATGYKIAKGRFCGGLAYIYIYTHVYVNIYSYKWRPHVFFICIYIHIMTSVFKTFQMALRWCSMLEFDGDLCCWCQVKTVPMTASHSGLAVLMAVGLHGTW